MTGLMRLGGSSFWCGGDRARLSNMIRFGRNPGWLKARTYIPADLPRGAPLVVVLHGCGQSASEYNHGAGWSVLADRHGFALLFPEQQRSNNLYLAFNWFAAGHSRRNRGEARSIREMVEAIVITHGIDRRRIFITGLSAGGAMTSVMLATYPDVFAGGAIIAGCPMEDRPPRHRHSTGCAEMSSNPTTNSKLWCAMLRRITALGQPSRSGMAAPITPCMRRTRRPSWHSGARCTMWKPGHHARIWLTVIRIGSGAMLEGVRLSRSTVSPGWDTVRRSTWRTSIIAASAAPIYWMQAYPRRATSPVFGG
jgi:poly(hydroxyalkanoate) depolymerase family esterase